MTIITGTVMAGANKYHRMFDTLIRASHRNYIDLEGFLPWADGVDKSVPPKKLDQLWICGTPYWDQLTEDQRLEVAWLETARDASMFIHLEHVIPTTYTGYAAQYRQALDPKVYEYLMLFAREEVTHILAFHRFLQVAGLPWYDPPGQGSYADFAARLPSLRPEVGIMFIMLIEWTAELAVMHATNSDTVEPLTRQLFRAHHTEEVRHLAFGKAIGDAFFESSAADEADEVRSYLRRLVQVLHQVFSYNPQIARYTSFHFPIQPDDDDAIRTVQNSEHNVVLNRQRFQELYEWCESHRIL
jgi:hypothetical protein